MPKRFLFVTIVAALLGALPLAGQAQLAPRNRDFGGSTANYNNPAAYGAPAGYGAPGMGPGGYDPVSTAASDPSRKLQPGDQLSFKIEEDREEGKLLTVSQTGDVIVEPLPQAVRVSSLTVASAAAEITRLLERDYYHKASVRLNLERAGITPTGVVSVSGSVNRVGSVPIMADRPMTVSGVILATGGFNQWADQRKVQVTRAGRGGGASETFVEDVKEVLNKGRVDLDRNVQDGDRIFVPERFIR